MKIYISADIEGVAGIVDPEEANPDKPHVAYFRDQMTREVLAACEGAMEAGATEILVKDAHWNGRNIDARKLPKCARMVRGWTGHPYSMMDQLNSSFDASLFIGYHSKAGRGTNPLAHTLNGRIVEELRINGNSVSEFLLNTFTATLENVPVAFVSGDKALCEEVKHYNENIGSFATFEGIGTGVVSEHPERALDGIRDGVCEKLKVSNLKKQIRPLPESFAVELDYKIVREAYGKSFFPGVELKNEKTLVFHTNEYFEVLRFISFCV